MEKNIIKYLSILAIDTCKNKLLLIAAQLTLLTIVIPLEKVAASDISGEYRCKTNNNLILTLYQDGNYVAGYDGNCVQHPVSQCPYFSKGRWLMLAENMLEITSDSPEIHNISDSLKLYSNYKLSQDSLYINIIFPIHSKNNYLQYEINGKEMIYCKSVHAWNDTVTTIVMHRKNLLNDSIFDMKISIFDEILWIFSNEYTKLKYDLFDNHITVEGQYNCIDIPFLYVDMCYLEFERLENNIMMLRNNKIYWRGLVWKKGLKCNKRPLF